MNGYTFRGGGGATLPFRNSLFHVAVCKLKKLKHLSFFLLFFSSNLNFYIYVSSYCIDHRLPGALVCLVCRDFEVARWGHLRWRARHLLPGPEVIKLFSCSTQLSMKFFLLINVKMPTIVGILTFMSGKK